jgi:hypothetical protein
VWERDDVGNAGIPSILDRETGINEGLRTSGLVASGQRPVVEAPPRWSGVTRERPPVAKSEITDGLA